MNNKQVCKKAAFKIIFLLVLGMGIAVGGNAQTPVVLSTGVFDDPGFDSSGGTPSDGGPTVPFDGGMSLLLAVTGICYVSKKITREKYLIQI